MNDILDRIEDQTLQAALAIPGSTANDIAKLLDINVTTASNRLLDLTKDGKLKRVKERRETLNGDRKLVMWAYYPGDGTPPEPASIAPRRHSVKAEEIWKQRYEEAMEALRELRAWKAQALARFPDLNVSEELLKARKIASKTSPEFATEFLAGRKDDCPIIKAILIALEETQS